ncbi:unnamed protein product [Spodoptera littoralis]|uniref:CHK kinase-like domain-containing protein n=1 Tax=Spodoptera littoralis TaxID=7109 RepID=A0A9P0MWD4_SPOLI|nr:unnamed protein product [Spodoptera littoralis]CAH1635821.1 unnamed protein product [Spodoptera littoralis]
MQAGGPDSTAVSEAPSSGSEDSDCEPGPETDADAALTEEWARELLAGAGVVDPHEVHVESRAGVAGALSRVLAVTVCYESNGERRALPLVVKLPPRDPFGRLFVAEAQFDTREILFYTELAPALNKLAEEAVGPGSGLPVPRCVKARLPAARLHALSLALRDREGPLDQRFDFLFPCERAAAGYLRLVRRGLPQLEAFLRGRPDCVEEAAAVSALSARAPSLLGTLLRPAEPAPLAHADFWSGNLLFREREGVSECIALDWQMVSLGRPMDDVALLLLSSLTPELRRSVGDTLIEEYGDRLEAECARLGAASAGVTVRRGLRPDWPRAALRALLLCAGSVDVALGEPRAERRLLEAVRDLHSQGVLALRPDNEA